MECEALDSNTLMPLSLHLATDLFVQSLQKQQGCLIGLKNAEQ